MKASDAVARQHKPRPADVSSSQPVVTLPSRLHDLEPALNRRAETPTVPPEDPERHREYRIFHKGWMKREAPRHIYVRIQSEPRS